MDNSIKDINHSLSIQAETLGEPAETEAAATFGGVIGSLLPINTEGISFVMTAMFVVIFMDQWLKEKNHTSSLLGLGISFLCLLVFGPDSFMIPTMILIIVSFQVPSNYTLGCGRLSREKPRGVW